MLRHRLDRLMLRLPREHDPRGGRGGMCSERGRRAGHEGQNSDAGSMQRERKGTDLI